MIFRRLVLSVVLILFASVTIGVIVGLDDAARSELVSRLPVSVTAAPSDSPSPSVSPTPSPSPTPSLTAVAKPKPFPTAQPATPKPSVKAQPSVKPSTQPKATTKPKASATPTPSRSPATTKPSAPNKPKGTKKTPPEYLTGPLKKGPGGTVYLTFDDGPGPYTARILQVLSSTGSTATFFHLGDNEDGYPYADAAIKKQGSKVASHSYDHRDLTTLKAAQLTWQVRNGPPAKCFRPPYGATNAKVRSAIAKAGMRQVLWDVDTFDWTRPGVSTLAKSGRLKAVRDGSVILMHDGGGDRTQTVAALPTIIRDLHTRGFKIRALPYC